MEDQVSIHWFRKDLRLHDNPSLQAAIESCSMLIPLYILEADFLDPFNVGTNRLNFLLKTLSCLDNSLKALGSKLVFVRGDVWEVLEKFIKEFSVKKLTFDHAVEPHMKIDEDVVNKAKDCGVEVETFCGHTLFDQDKLLQLNNNKAPLTMAEFMKIVAQAGTPAQPLPSPEELPPLPPRLDKWKGVKQFKAIPSVDDLEEVEVVTTSFVPGETTAVENMNAYLSQVDRVTSFDSSKTNPASIVPDTTALSPYIANGSLSVRLFYHKLQETFESLPSPVSKRLQEQLYWRELAYLIGYSTPNFNKLSGNPYCVCLQIPMLTNKQTKGLFVKWAQGMTGYPVIDACMGQLKTEGWMHYAARHLCASFLTRGDLSVSWRLGRNVFQKYLLDADWCINTFCWHLLSCNSFFEHHFTYFDPTSHFKAVDPTGNFIRKYIPALREFPDDYIYEPWCAPREIQEGARCVIGVDYPKPFGKEVVLDCHCHGGQQVVGRPKKKCKCKDKRSDAQPPFQPMQLLGSF